MTATKRTGPMVGALLAISLLLGASACSSNSTDTAAEDRTAAASDCPARFGCAKTPTSFQVRNDTDEAIELVASSFTNVREADRLSLTMTVPARSTSETKPVYLGDDGLEGVSGTYVRGGYRGQWTWEIRTATSSTSARVALASNEDFDLGVGVFEGWSHIGQPLPEWASAYEPVVLTAADGSPTWNAVGSFIDSLGGDRPTMTWTFSPPGETTAPSIRVR